LRQNLHYSCNKAHRKRLRHLILRFGGAICCFSHRICPGWAALKIVIVPSIPAHRNRYRNSFSSRHKVLSSRSRSGEISPVSFSKEMPFQISRASSSPSSSALKSPSLRKNAHVLCSMLPKIKSLTRTADILERSSPSSTPSRTICITRPVYARFNSNSS